MKKKVVAACMTVALASVAVGGATLAYFTDDDVQKNTFTTGNVAIDLWEDFGDDDSGIAELIPATGSAQDDTLKNGVEKEIYVTNLGSEDAYVRVHIAIPSILDNGATEFDAGKNVLHFNGAEGTYVDGKWNWSDSEEGNDNLADGKMINGDWNYYTTTINDKSYNVYVVTYETALVKDGATVDAIHQVYLDSKVTNEDITKIKADLGDNWYIYVAAQGTQAAGFGDAFEALNAAFPTLQLTEAEWTAVAKGETFVNLED